MTAVSTAPVRSETRAFRAVLPQIAPFLGILAGAMILPFVSNDYWALIGTRAAIYWVLVSGLNLIVGFAGHLAIGYVALLTLGAYATSVLVAGNVAPPIP
ncbi:MAG: branched-chain amino acid transport system ATP-binding protein livM, partial [Bradyrhizobium sp.]|nr:branched-chain amino acid transport system ATP-binding protein livM [Bradyrhizobium sp.]